MTFMRCLLTANRCYKTNQKIKPKGIMVHSTGANNPLLRRYVQPLDHDVKDAYDPDRTQLLKILGVNRNHNDWNRPNLDACVHAFIGKMDNGKVGTIQTLPWDHRGWHAGDGTSGRSANDTHIAFEICEDGLNDANYFRQVYSEAVELTACLCLSHSLDPMADGVIICHQDGYRRGIASNHGDIYNWFPRFGKSMDDFRLDVATKIAEDTKIPDEEGDDMVYYKYFEDIPKDFQPSIKKCIDAGALKGTGDNELNVSRDFCRTMTVLDRMGKLD